MGGLTLEKIEGSIYNMDNTYDANFGEWIRNEDNARIVAYNMKKYVDDYKASDFIVVLKWIVKDWTLKSIIIFSKKMLIDDIKTLNNAKSDSEKEKYNKRISILSGLIYTWNSIFITEFVISTTRGFSINEKIKALVTLLSVFENKKLSEILLQLESKIEHKVHGELLKALLKAPQRKVRTGSRRSVSMVKAYNIS